MQPPGVTCAEGYVELGMWQQAWDELEDLEPAEKVCLPVLLLHVRILEGLKEWQKALLLVSSVSAKFPHREDVTTLYCDILIAHAKVEAVAGNLDRAKELVAQCVRLDLDRRLEIVETRELEGLW